MQQKNIIGYDKEYETKEHPSIKGLQIIEGKNNFPISWLNKQGYCEYQLYLEYMKGVETATNCSHDTWKPNSQSTRRNFQARLNTLHI